MDDHDDRLRRIEEKVDRLLDSRENAVNPDHRRWDDDDPGYSAGREEESDEVEVDPRPADLALSVRTAEKGRDGKYVVRAEIGNYGEGSATRVRWWLSSEEGELVSTLGGSDDTRIGPREAMQLEVVEIPGWENYPFQKLWCRLAWSDADGDHEKRRQYVESSRGMWKWRRRRKQEQDHA